MQIRYKFVDDGTSKHAVWIAKGEIIRHAFFPRFSRGCESCETGSAPAWTLLSLTSAVISHGCWLSYNDCLSGRLSAAQNPVLSALIGTHIFAQGHIKHCSHPPLQGIMGIWVPRHTGKQRLDGWSTAASSTNMGSKIDWKNHSNMRGWPWSAASPSKPESILLPAFLHPPFAPLLLGFSEGAPSPGPHHSLPMVPKEAQPSTKAAVIAILHSPPPSWKPHFNLKHPPSPHCLILPHPLWTWTGQSRPPWDTYSGRSQGSTSQDVRHG